jgi:hypothetical protein
LRLITEALWSDDRDVCDDALKELARLEDEKLAAGDIDGWLAYLWQESMILERLGRRAETLTLLERISAERDKLAESAPSAHERAGVSSSFRDLAPRMAVLRLRHGAGTDAVFAAIESGKCRWLADSARGKPQELSEFRESVAEERVHYLTYAVGSDATAAVLVLGRGDPLAREIPIGRDAIVRTANEMVNLWKFGAALATNLAEQLGQLTNWLPSPTPDGLMRPGDVLIVSPHGALHSIPIHAMPASDGSPLAPRLAVVRAHGAVLVGRTAVSSAQPVSSGLALHATAENERQRDRRAASFGNIVRDLKDIFPCEVLEGVNADFASLRVALRRRQAIHLFAHGDALAAAPYSRSGILFPSRGILPTLGWRAFYTDNLISPERIASTDFSGALAGSHVTLQVWPRASEPEGRRHRTGVESSSFGRRQRPFDPLACRLWHQHGILQKFLSLLARIRVDSSRSVETLRAIVD